MTEKPKFRMGRGEKVFLWGAGILVGLVFAVAIPALLHQRDRARAKAAIEETAKQVQPSTALVPPNVGSNGDSSAQVPNNPDINEHGAGIPQDMIPLVPITSLVEVLPRPELVYPEEARSANIQGAIQVEVTVSTAGVPVTAVSLDGPGILRTAAENWQMKRRFKPPVFEGLVQPVKFVNGVSFTIEDVPTPKVSTRNPSTENLNQPAASSVQAQAEQPPRVVTQAPPVFPPRARQMRWETNRDHTVALKVFVSEQGQPLLIKVVDGASFGFDEAAKDAARKSTFSPAMKNGHPIRAWLEMRVVIPRIGQ